MTYLQKLGDGGLMNFLTFVTELAWAARSCLVACFGVPFRNAVRLEVCAAWQVTLCSLDPKYLELADAGA